MTTGFIMRPLFATVMSLGLATSALAQSEPELKITRNGAQPASKGPAAFFTGDVRVDTLFSAA
jgi:hypothetical protein